MNLYCVRWVRRNDIDKKTFQMRNQVLSHNLISFHLKIILSRPRTKSAILGRFKSDWEIIFSNSMWMCRRCSLISFGLLSNSVYIQRAQNTYSRCIHSAGVRSFSTCIFILQQSSCY